LYEGCGSLGSNPASAASFSQTWILVNIFNNKIKYKAKLLWESPEALVPDRLIWKHAKTGQYSVKLGYKLLTGRQGGDLGNIYVHTSENVPR
jgi:hypothetical protein